MRLNVNLNLPNAAKEIEEHYREKIHKTMKMAVVECLRELITVTPVDTGRARYGYFCSVGTPSQTVPPEGDYSTPPDANARANEMGNYTIDNTLYITNRVPYIGRLNNGWSKQAPARFVERAVARTELAVNQYLQSKG